MGFPANFTAIDFETANRRRDSACQLAAVVVRDGQIFDERMWMIRPDPFFFSPGNIRIHGICPGDVEEEPNFGELWDEIAGVLGNDCLIAHNASFDIGVLVACLQRHRRAVPEMHFSCTRLIARQTWPERQRYGLKPLANWLGVQFRHHDALEDARACSKILLAAGISRRAESLESLEQSLSLLRGRAGEWGVRGVTRPGQRKRRTKATPATRRGTARRVLRRASPTALMPPIDPFAGLPSQTLRVHETEVASDRGVVAPLGEMGDYDFQRVAIRAEFIQPFRGKHVLVCGRLRRISSEHARELTRRGGGIAQLEPDECTDCLIIGADDADGGPIPSLIAGRSVEVISEAEFFNRLGG